MKNLIMKSAAAAVIASAALSAATFAPVASAQYRPAPPPMAGLREIHGRQSEQMARIERGFQRGGITRGEYQRLMGEQREISAMERAYTADGFLTPPERAELNRRLDFASQHIRFEAHDGQNRRY